MPDNVEQVAEDTPELDDQSGQAATQTDAAVGEESTASGHDDEQYLTLAQVQELLATTFAEYDRQNRRTQQSQLDKRDGKFRGWLTQQAAQIESLTEFAKQTLGLDDAAVQKLQGGLTKRVLDAVSESKRASRQRQAYNFDEFDAGDDDTDDDRGRGQGQQYDHDAVMDQAWDIWERYSLDRGDPEAALIATTGVSPQEYLRSIEYAGRLKAQRVGQKTPPKKPAQEGDEGKDGKASARSPAASPGGKHAGGVNPIAKITDPSELYKLATQELDKIRG